MNHLSARQMLASVVTCPKICTPAKSSQQSKCSGRQTNLSKRTETRGKSHRKYYQHRVHPAEPFVTPFDIESTYQLQKYPETSTVINNSRTSHRYSHKLFSPREQNALLRMDDARISQNKLPRHKYEFSLPKTSRQPSHEQQKLDLTSKTQALSKGKCYLMKRVIKNMQGDVLNSTGTTNKPLEVQLKQLNYYVPDIKKSVHEFTHNREYVSSHLNHFMQSLSAFQMFSQVSLPKEPTKINTLPPAQSDKITLLFDLDETLIHTQIINWDTDEHQLAWGKIVEISSQLGSYRVNLKIRPHVIEVLQRLKDKFQIGIFTASQQFYGQTLLKEIDPNGDIFSFKLYRQHCFEMQSKTAHVKDLRILKGRDLSRVILIDNSPHTYLFQKNNAIPIISFFNDPQDTEMLKLESFLQSLKNVKDVRRVLRQYFKLQQYHHYNNLVRLVKQLYH